jgi:hypothetical protein
MAPIRTVRVTDIYSAAFAFSLTAAMDAVDSLRRRRDLTSPLRTAG